ncbi:hypothetical protein EX895_000935 [Sporisorium graminicola]|uniref:Thioesterase domain-containing protein n=1 Tax=Sporisorium graminicola TaxID=280036 RepID=A0A4U7L2G8_9BASI|nr:hypothetical protein EX895_000935 [Sporisorium graminicola]TKY90937.1 hypothetical protein EX895_000935 [Sporisorium graminicola]
MTAAPRMLRGLPLASRSAPTPLRGAHRTLTTSALVRDPDARPASSQLFSPSEVQAGIAALKEAGYDGQSVWEQRVVWGDHDQFQHVNNVHFVRWFESARMFFANSLTNTPDFTEQRREEINRGTGKSFILAGINVRYRRPVLYPDIILVGQACELPLGKDRFMLRGAAYSLAQKTIVAVSAQDCVTYDYTKLAKCDIPDDIRNALQSKGAHFDKKL